MAKRPSRIELLELDIDLRLDVSLERFQAAAAKKAGRGLEPPGHHHVAAATPDPEGDGVETPPLLGVDRPEVGDGVHQEPFVWNLGDTDEHRTRLPRGLFQQVSRKQRFLRPP